MQADKNAAPGGEDTDTATDEQVGDDYFDQQMASIDNRLNSLTQAVASIADTLGKQTLHDATTTAQPGRASPVRARSQTPHATPPESPAPATSASAPAPEQAPRPSHIWWRKLW